MNGEHRRIVIIFRRNCRTVQVYKLIKSLNRQPYLHQIHTKFFKQITITTDKSITDILVLTSTPETSSIHSLNSNTEWYAKRKRPGLASGHPRSSKIPSTDWLLQTIGDPVNASQARVGEENSEQ